MDIRLYGQVLWRFKFLVAAGVVVAIALAGLSYAKVSFAHGKPTFAYRQTVLWEAQETLLITEQGFPEGRATFPVPRTPNSTPAFADPSRLADLADFYARLANSDAVRSLLRLKKGVAASLTASPVISSVSNGGLLPILAIGAVSTTPANAITAARAASAAFRLYLDQRQARAGIPESQRVLLSVLNGANGAFIATPRKKTVPILVFVAVLGATIGLALILENMRPRVRVGEKALAAQEFGAERGSHPAPVAGVGRADVGR